MLRIKYIVLWKTSMTLYLHEAFGHLLSLVMNERKKGGEKKGVGM